MRSLVISFFICLLAFHTTNSIYESCSGKAFLCKDSTHFQICTDIGPDSITITLDDNIQACPDKTVCNMKNTVECTGPAITTPKPKVTTVTRKVTAVKPTLAPEIKCPRKGNFANPSDCHSYYKCEGSKRITVKCAWNSVFSSAAGMCVHEKQSCGSTVDEIPCYLNGGFRDPKNCQSYVNCQREGGKWKKSKVYCSSYYSFHDTSGKCVHGSGGCH